MCDTESVLSALCSNWNTNENAKGLAATDKLSADYVLHTPSVKKFRKFLNDFYVYN